MQKSIFEITDEIKKTADITLSQLKEILCSDDTVGLAYLSFVAREVCQSVYGKKIYLRGLIEFTNFCKNDCYYCGIRCSNKNTARYRMSLQEILDCCQIGSVLGFHTFVLQGGEDPFFSCDDICKIVRTIKIAYPACAVTLSIGEWKRDAYEKFFEAGADRFLLRHETANEKHFAKLHPSYQTLQNRFECLKNLHEIGFQTGCGFMVGSPHQSAETIFEDLQFIKKFRPEMVGIGPFIPHAQTPFAHEKSGSIETVLRLLSIVRLLLPRVLLPATTALATVDKDGREKGVLSGANVVMPNLSPTNIKKKYTLYDGKPFTDTEVSEALATLQKNMKKIGYEIDMSRGDFKRA